MRTLFVPQTSVMHMENTNNTRITGTALKYLFTIYEIGAGERAVKCVDISNRLNVSKPSVHSMVNSLSKQGIISKAPYGRVSFTPEGVKLVETYKKYYENVNPSLQGLFRERQNIQDAVCAFIAGLPAEALIQLS